MKRTALIVLALLSFAGCAGTSRKACQQALRNGWCYEGCRQQPETCCKPKDVRCSPDGLCTWTGCDGSTVFGVRKPLSSTSDDGREKG